jgi:integrase/recombinase XerD
MTEKGIDGDFTTVDTAMLNRYFRDYHQRHGQGGTNAQQRNLLPLFKFLQEEHGHPHPYTSKLNRYTEIRGRPKTLSGDFVSDVLDVTGSGKARDFETAWNHALIRILRNEGARRGAQHGYARPSGGQHPAARLPPGTPERRPQ